METPITTTETPKPKKPKKRKPPGGPIAEYGYVEGIGRGLNVALKTAYEAELPPDETVRLCVALSVVVFEMRIAKDMEKPFVHRAIIKAWQRAFPGREFVKLRESPLRVVLGATNDQA